MRQSGPVITLTTDFGCQDSYAAELKLVLMRLAPAARVIDITHSIPAQDVVAGSFVLQRVISGFVGRGVHVAGVGSGGWVGGPGPGVPVREGVLVCPGKGVITSVRRC